MTVYREGFLKWLKALDLEISNLIDLRDEARRLLEPPESNPPSQSDGPPPDGAWRDLPPTDKQLATLDKCKINYREGLTRGEASDIIKGFFARRDR